MEIWLQQQASAVLTALAHAQELYGDPTTPRQNLNADLGGEVG